MKYIIVVFFFVFSTASSATSYSPLSTIKSMSLGTTYARVKLHSMGSMEPDERCGENASSATGHGNFVLDLTDENTKEMFSSITPSAENL